MKIFFAASTMHELVIVVLCGLFAHGQSAAPNPNALDPFVGSYHIGAAYANNYKEFSGNLGVPTSVISQGEVQVMEKVSDGVYKQSILRANASYNSYITFQLGVPGTQVGPVLNFTYIYNMINETSLQFTFNITSSLDPPKISFTCTFEYGTNGIMIDTADNHIPTEFIAQAIFFKVADENAITNSNQMEEFKFREVMYCLPNVTDLLPPDTTTAATTTKAASTIY